MLLVEVMVPALERRYDFELEESATAGVLIREMITVICQREHCACFEGEQGLSLYSQEQERRLGPDEILATSGVQNGQRLILV